MCSRAVLPRCSPERFSANTMQSPGEQTWRRTVSTNNKDALQLYLNHNHAWMRPPKIHNTRAKHLPLREHFRGTVSLCQKSFERLDL